MKDTPILQQIDEPGFSSPIANVTAPLGREAVLACAVHNLSSYKVCSTFIRTMLREHHSVTRLRGGARNCADRTSQRHSAARRCSRAPSTISPATRSALLLLELCSENVTAPLGREAVLACAVHNLSSYKVCSTFIRTMLRERHSATQPRGCARVRRPQSLQLQGLLYFY
ncbi:Opioid-binding protein/cell adhesion molecule [Operophtera brumata]|uniref:Opioid-binding protein/cell adhesion molecule n=1 Tax=Operophtera brumata TaxID=104452 RepID=A0A0L7L618_OPEBR|nr:Opioid-binding protein/cell adhesion molecule [Operophtera brumata]